MFVYNKIMLIKNDKFGCIVDKAAIFCYKMIIINITFIRTQTTTMDTDEERKQRLKKEGTLHPNPDKVHADLLAKSPFFDANDLMQMNTRCCVV